MKRQTFSRLGPLSVVLLLALNPACRSKDSDGSGHKPAPAAGESLKSPKSPSSPAKSAEQPGGLGRHTLRDPTNVDRRRLAETLRQAAVSGRDFLIRGQEPSGRFNYRIDLDGQRLKPKYNVLRHSGTLYAFGMMHRENLGSQGPDAKVSLADGLLRGAKYLRERHIKPVKGLENTKAAFSLPGEEKTPGQQRMAKMGGAALAIVGLLEAHNLKPDAVDLKDLQDLARFIQFMQLPDGNFRAKYSEADAFAHDFKSLYYPGEGILALVGLYTLDKNPAWLETAARAAHYLVESRKGVTKLPADHWLLIAGETLLPLLTDQHPISADDLYAHLKVIGDLMLGEFESHQSQALPHSKGAFGNDGRSTPTATRMEGLIALARTAQSRGDAELARRIKAVLPDAAIFLLGCQVESGAFRGGVVRGAQRLSGDDAKVKKHNRRQREVRIDYVQHAISAWLGVAELCPTGCPEAAKHSN